MSLVELKIAIAQIVTQSQGNHPPQSTINALLLSVFISILQKPSLTSCHKSTIWFTLTSFRTKRGTQTAILITHYVAFRHEHKNPCPFDNACTVTGQASNMPTNRAVSVRAYRTLSSLHDASNIFTSLVVIFSVCYSEYTVSLTSSSGENKQYYMVCTCSKSELTIKKN